MDPKILDELAKSNPALIERYKARMEAADKGYDSARSRQNYIGYANVLGKALTDYNNSQKNDVVLRNRIQSLGARPSILEAEKSVYDDSSDKMAADAVKMSEADRNRVFDDYKQGRAIASDAQAIQSSERMRDPNSTESRNARAFIKQFSPNYPGLEGMSAAEIEAYAPGIMKKYQIDQEASLKREMAARERAEKPPTADQGKIASFGKRLEQSEAVFADLKKRGYNRADYTSAMAANIFPPAFSSEEFKKQDQAERNFINAVLRRESGAVISPEEFANAERQYFPRAGDPESVIKQKENNRKLVQEGFKREAANAWDERPVSDIIQSSEAPSFPMTVRKDGKSATVKNQGQLNNALSKGWK